MKRTRVLAFFICMFFVAVLSLPGLVKNVQGQGEEGKPEAVKSGETSPTREKFAEEKKEFKAKARARLDELGRKIDELESEFKKTGSEMKAETKEELQKLKEKRAALKKEMKKLKAKSKAKWKKAKQKIQAGEDELEEAYNKVRGKAKSE